MKGRLSSSPKRGYSEIVMPGVESTPVNRTATLARAVVQRLDICFGRSPFTSFPSVELIVSHYEPGRRRLNVSPGLGFKINRPASW
jgi:hypothetical protein